MYDNQRMNSHSIATELATEWCEWRIDFMHIYIIQSSDTNEKLAAVIGYTVLYQNFHFYCFLVHMRLWTWVQFRLFNICSFIT